MTDKSNNNTPLPAMEGPPEDARPLDLLHMLRQDMEKCFRCSLCKMVPLPVVKHVEFTDACPAARYYHFHGFSGSGKSIMALSLLDGRIEPDDALARTAFACTACGFCDVACKFIMDAERQRINMALREHLTECGRSPFIYQATPDKELNKYPPRKSLHLISNVAGVNKIIAGSVKTLVFAGCSPENDEQGRRTAERLAKLLVAAGVDISTAGELEHCCGLPFYWKGNRDYFRFAASSIARLLRESGVQRVIVLSGSCLGAMRSKYAEYGVELGVEVVHATEVLAELFLEGRLKLDKSISAAVTYHDPCYLGRQSEPFVKEDSEERLALNLMTYTDPPRHVNRGAEGVYDAPRRLLRSLPGIEFREMYRIREYSFCCGGGGGAPEAFPELSKSAALHRLEEARAVGADVLATACAHCRARFESAQQELEPDRRLRIEDVVDLVFEASGLAE